jgi:hypothetical protein
VTNAPVRESISPSSINASRWDLRAFGIVLGEERRFVITHDFIRPTRVPNGQSGNALLDTTNAGGDQPVERAAAGPFPVQSFADGPDDGVRDRLAGQVREFSCQPLGIGVLDLRVNLCLSGGP